MDSLANTIFLVLCGMCIIISVNGQNKACRTPNSVVGKCIPLTDCAPLFQIFNKKSLTQDEINFLQLSKCGGSNEMPSVCCVETGHEYVEPAARPTNSPISCRTPYGIDGECMDLEKCDNLYTLAQKEPKTLAEEQFLRLSKCKEEDTLMCCPKQSVPFNAPKPSYDECVTPDGKTGKCAPIQKCSKLHDLYVKPDRSSEETNFLEQSYCSQDNNELLACCPTILMETAIIEEEMYNVNQCHTPNGLNGECVPCEECSYLYNLYGNAANLTQEELKFLLDSQCTFQNVNGFCCVKDKLEVIGNTTNKILEQETTATTTTTTTTTTSSAPPTAKKCLTPNELNGTCISLSNCDSLRNILLKKEFFPNDIKYLNASFCADGGNLPIVCCPDNVTYASPETSLPPYCGVVSYTNSKEDNAATTTEIDEYPWTALLVYKNNKSQTSTRCDGTLIHSRYVLTAAHCVKDDDDLSSVRLGAWAKYVNEGSDDCNNVDADQNECIPTPLDVIVQSVIVHPDFKNLALLRLASEAPHTRFISPICLPFAKSQLLNTYENNSLYITGWGKEIYYKKKSIVKVQKSSECIYQYWTKAGIYLTSEHLCAFAGSVKKNMIGDSGSALMSLETIGSFQSYFLAGVKYVNHENLLNQGYPVIYTNIGAYLDWIMKEIWDFERSDSN